MITRDTTELGLAFTVAAVGIPTRAASLAGVGRIDKQYQHTTELHLVADKRPQLREGPIAVSCALPRAIHPRALANVRQVLQRNRPLHPAGTRFGFGNQAL